MSATWRVTRARIEAGAAAFGENAALALSMAEVAHKAPHFLTGTAWESLVGLDEAELVARLGELVSDDDNVAEAEGLLAFCGPMEEEVEEIVEVSAPAPTVVTTESVMPRPREARATLEGARKLYEELVQLHVGIVAEPGNEERLFALRQTLLDADRVLWRLGFKTFRTLVDSVDATILAQAGSRFAPPAALIDLIREVIALIDAMIAGTQSRRKTYYEMVERLNLIRARVEEDIATDREARRAEREAKGIAAPAAGASAPDQPQHTKLQRLFLREMGQHLNSMTRALLLVERDPGNQEVIFSLMRSAHSIKGAGGIAKYTEIARFAHGMEDLLVAIRDNGLRMTPSAINLTLRGVDVLQLLMEEAEHGEESVAGTTDFVTSQIAALTEDVIANADAYRVRPDELDAAARERIGISAAREEDSSTRKVETRYVMVDIEQLDRLMNLAADLIINRTRLSSHVETMRAEVGRLHDARRNMQTLGSRLKRASEESGATTPAQGARAVHGRGDFLRDFGSGEFRRFNALDLWGRDLREEVGRLDGVVDGLGDLAGDFDQTVALVSQIANDLNESITRVRMIPLGQVFERFPRAVRDLADKLGKRVTLDIRGGETPLDKSIVEEVSDPLMHILRNALDHGIETPEERSREGKTPTGRIGISARQTGNQVLIEVRDDGRGIDPERLRTAAVAKGFMEAGEAATAGDRALYDLLLAPGFSTAKEVTDVSGRGVGLDVVSGAVAALNGSLSIASAPGEGTTFTLRFPMTLAIAQALLFVAGGQKLALPLANVLEVVSLNRTGVFRVEGHEVFSLRDALIPLVDLRQVLGLADTDPEDRQVILVGEPTRRTGLIVDSLIGREEIVVKNLGSHLKEVPYVSGGTILADGSVTLILDSVRLANLTSDAHGAMTHLIGGEREASHGDARVAKTRRADAMVHPVAITHEDVEASGVAGPAPAKPQGQRRRPPSTRPSRPSSTPPPSRKAEAPMRRIGAGSAVSVKEILVVDDAVSVRTYVTSILESAGFRTTEACDGVEALDRLQKGRFDLVLTDLEMPRMHGFELIAEIKNAAHLRHLPVVILTGRMGEKHSRKGLELGAAAFLVKPFEDAELLATIRRLLAVEGPT